MCVGTEERGKRPNLIPPHQHLGLRVAKESTDISCGNSYVSLTLDVSYRCRQTSREGHTRNAIAEDHWNTNRHMLPRPKVVARPDCTDPL